MTIEMETTSQEHIIRKLTLFSAIWVVLTTCLTGAVVNVPAGGNANIPANTIPGTMHVYVVGPANAAYSVQVGNGPNWNYNRPAGDTESVHVNNAAVSVGNIGPSRIQLLYVTANDELLAPKAFVSRVKGSDSSAQQAMKTLTAQYYNAVINGCGLDPNQFQLFQAHLPLGNLSEDLWHIFDSVPPKSITQYYNPSQFNIFSQDYGGVINHLNPQNSDKFQAKMADYYPQWRNYLKTNPKMPKGGILQLFKNWSALNMPPGLANDCYVLYEEISQSTITQAVQSWISMQTSASNPKIAAYDKTIEDLRSALQAAQPQNFVLDSSTESSDISHSWAKTEAGGLLDWFWGGGDASYSKWTSQITSAGVTMKVSFDRLVNFPAGPLYEPSENTLLSAYTPWFNSEALSIAYHNNNNDVWQHGAPTWAGTFGTSGNMQRVCTALIVVDGITLNVSSEASIASGDYESFKTAVSGGFFPFFEASGSGGWTHSTTFDDNGSFKITSKCATGNPQVLGVLVGDITTRFSK